MNVLPLSYLLLNVICPLNNSASFWLNNPNEASPQTHEHVMLVPKLRTTRHLRRTQAPTFMRYMNRAPRGIRHPDIGTEPLQGNHRSLGLRVRPPVTRFGVRKATRARGRGCVRSFKNLTHLQQLLTLKPSRALDLKPSTSPMRKAALNISCDLGCRR